MAHLPSMKEGFLQLGLSWAEFSSNGEQSQLFGCFLKWWYPKMDDL